LRALLASADSPIVWPDVRVVEQTGSTNADLLALAAGRDCVRCDPVVLVAEVQVAGRGRLQRSWTSPPRAGLTFSLLLYPAPPIAHWGWLPLLAGVALADAVAADTDVPVWLKWPNDLLVGPDQRKVAGILVQAQGRAAVVGIGLNVTTSFEELPVAEAASLALAGIAATDRTVLLAAILGQLARRYTSWRDAGGDAGACGLAADYAARCATIGREVTVTVADGQPLLGLAKRIDPDGRLVLDTSAGEVAVAAGDVRHVRPR
jgi:BirA family biotin operon repressor/biotin-[acetyl-CoA-carboxylase] ligase